eukprot:GHVT01004605.1.p1 GENE.GHVT01004605.1~~GHVT01004605.1.p1  ORF type:complete len:470 (+),score=107.45 GHVT01004605.1:218-1627(+)
MLSLPLQRWRAVPRRGSGGRLAAFEAFTSHARLPLARPPPTKICTASGPVTEEWAGVSSAPAASCLWLLRLPRVRRWALGGEATGGGSPWGGYEVACARAGLGALQSPLPFACVARDSPRSWAARPAARRRRLMGSCALPWTASSFGAFAPAPRQRGLHAQAAHVRPWQGHVAPAARVPLLAYPAHGLYPRDAPADTQQQRSGALFPRTFSKWPAKATTASAIAGEEPQADAPLVDSYGRRHNYLRVSLTERCNLRCVYCMPPNGVELTPASRLLQADEIQRLAAMLVTHAGVDKIRLTGGEPTVRRDFGAVVESLGALPGLRTLAISSNGLALARHLDLLKAAGVNAVNVSLDSLKEEKFDAITRSTGGLPKVLRLLDELVRQDFCLVKINCVLMRGVNDEEIESFVALTSQLPVHVRFIEFMPFAANGKSNLPPMGSGRLQSLPSCSLPVRFIWFCLATNACPCVCG